MPRLHLFRDAFSYKTAHRVFRIAERSASRIYRVMTSVGGERESNETLPERSLSLDPCLFGAFANHFEQPHLIFAQPSLGKNNSKAGGAAKV